MDRATVIDFQNSPQRVVALFVAAQFLLWILIPGLTHPNPPLDVIEGLTWGERLQWGYFKHPPLQAALLELALWLTGSGAWGAYLLSQIALVATYGAVWALARRLVGTHGAAASVLLLFGVFYFQYPTPEFNPNVLQLPFWAWAIYFLYRGWRDDRLIDWIGLGAVMAANLYSKYSAAILAVPMLVFLLADKDGRRRLAGRGPWLALATTGLLFLPHLFWLVANDFPSLRYALGRGAGDGAWIDHLRYPAKFFGAQLADHAGLLLLVGALTVLGRRDAPAGAPIRADSTAQRFVVVMGLGPFLVALALSAAFGIKLKDMWGAPMFTLSGLLAVIWWQPRPSAAFGRRLVIGVAALSVAVLTAYGAVQLAGPWLRGKPGKGAFPATAAAAALGGEWETRLGGRPEIFVGSTWIAGNIALATTPRASVLIDGDFNRSPWLSPADINRRGAMLVWQEGRESPPVLPDTLAGRLSARGRIEAPWNSAAAVPPLVLNWAILAPEAPKERP